MHKIDWTDEMKAYVREHWLAGAPREAIAKELKISEGALTRQIERLGLPRRETHAAWSDEKRKQFLALRADNVPAETIARTLGVSVNAIYRRSRGLPKRDRVSMVSNRSPIAVATRPARAPVEIEAVPPGNTNRELRPTSQCQWFYGRNPPFIQCQNAHVKDRPFCVEHCERAYKPWVIT